MANSIYKVTANGVSVIDLSDTTAVASDIKKGKAAHLQDGSLAYGTDDRPSKVSSVTLTSSGIHKAPEDESWTMVNVDIPYETPKPVTPANDVQVVKPSTNYEALASVTINPIPDDYIVPTGEINIKNNGRHNVKLYEHAFVEVQPNLENKKITITQNGVKTYSAGFGYDGIETIEVNVQVPPEDFSLQNKEVTITENKEETYYADANMTWAEWVNSDYNTGGYYEEFGNSIYRGSLHGTSYRISTDGTFSGVVKPSEYVTAGAYKEYAYTSSGGGAD